MGNDRNPSKPHYAMKILVETKKSPEYLNVDRASMEPKDEKLDDEPKDHLGDDRCKWGIRVHGKLAKKGNVTSALKIDKSH